MALTPSVIDAINDIRAAYPHHTVSVEEDTDGGAFVEVDDLLLGEQYEPSRSWTGFRITFQYPMADVYPHFVINGLRRKDGQPLGESFQLDNQGWQPQVATMVSRRSNRRDPSTETAAIKLEKVLSWIRSR